VLLLLDELQRPRQQAREAEVAVGAAGGGRGQRHGQTVALLGAQLHQRPAAQRAHRVVQVSQQQSPGHLGANARSAMKVLVPNLHMLQFNGIRNYELDLTVFTHCYFKTQNLIKKIPPVLDGELIFETPTIPEFQQVSTKHTSHPLNPDATYLVKHLARSNINVPAQDLELCHRLHPDDQSVTSGYEQAHVRELDIVGEASCEGVGLHVVYRYHRFSEEKLKQCGLNSTSIARKSEFI